MEQERRSPTRVQHAGHPPSTLPGPSPPCSRSCHTRRPTGRRHGWRPPSRQPGSPWCRLHQGGQRVSMTVLHPQHGAACPTLWQPARALDGAPALRARSVACPLPLPSRPVLPTCPAVSLGSIVPHVKDRGTEVRNQLVSSHVPRVAPVSQASSGLPQLAIPAPQPAAVRGRQKGGGRSAHLASQAGAAVCTLGVALEPQRVPGHGFSVAHKPSWAIQPAACLYCTVALPSSAGKGGKGA